VIRPRALGAIMIVGVFALDQATKFMVSHGFGAAESGSLALTPFLDLALRWNPGISFSLLAQHTTLGVGLLLAFTIAAISALSVWLWRTPHATIGLGLGFIIGGAVGNAVDRFSYGAVIDFLDLHFFGRHFFVFNIADAAINLGVILLIFDGLFLGGTKTPARRSDRS
jgi:lipoprotein signal peptidase